MLNFLNGLKVHLKNIWKLIEKLYNQIMYQIIYIIGLILFSDINKEDKKQLKQIIFSTT